MRGRRRKGVVFRCCWIFVLFISVLFGAFCKRLEKPFNSAFAAYASEFGNRAIHYAVDECFENVSHKELVLLTYNPSGEVVSVASNTSLMNRIKSDINSKIKEYFASAKDKYVRVYLGALQDNLLLNGAGPEFKIKVKPYAMTKVSFRDEFVSVGVNQVRHCIYADVSAKITILSFASERSFEVNNTLIVSDTVIVGRVPQAYGGFFNGINNKLE